MYQITANTIYKSKWRNACITQLIQDCNLVVIHVHNMVSKSTIILKKHLYKSNLAANSFHVH